MGGDNLFSVRERAFNKCHSPLDLISHSLKMIHFLSVTFSPNTQKSRDPRSAPRFEDYSTVAEVGSGKLLAFPLRKYLDSIMPTSLLRRLAEHYLQLFL
jgi:hypothetical protein